MNVEIAQPSGDQIAGAYGRKEVAGDGASRGPLRSMKSLVKAKPLPVKGRRGMGRRHVNQSGGL